MAHNYILQVTAGPEYDLDTHQIVPVNATQPVHLSSSLVDVRLNVRIQDYHGLPRASPSTSPYFNQPPHAKNKDQYSISFAFTPKQAINGDDLVFGNDFDHPIRDRLPPGFNTAFKIVRWAVDPGLDGDVYADRPYLYGPALSSVNTLRVVQAAAQARGDKEEAADEASLVVVEGGDVAGQRLRKDKGVPESEAQRKKYFLNAERRKEWLFEPTMSYECDFFNPYLDFNDFALRLPGFTLPIMKYWDGQPLRYVLKNRATDTVLFVVLFTLYLKTDVDEQGNVRDGVVPGKPFAEGACAVGVTDDDGAEQHDEHAGEHAGDKQVPAENDDDVD